MVFHPTKIGKYTVESVLGHGGMGVVYKAVDSQIGRYVAIKMIHSAGDAGMVERFCSEARSTGSLQCPNIVTVFDFGEQDGNPYLVMQYLEGSSLESIIQKGTQISFSERLGVIIDVCNGLAYAHQRGIIHRDIKPANVVVLQDGHNDGMAVIVDFGIARIAGSTRLTKTDQVIGSLHYMSPEQLQAKELDNRTDIYSVGIVLYRLLTGVLPFDTPDTAATLLKILNEDPPPLSAYVKDYPPELDGIINRALAKNHDQRYLSAQDLAFDLSQVQERSKSDAVAQIIKRAEAAFSREDWTRARDHLQQAIRIDRQNTQAKKLMTAVQERLLYQKQLEQARALRSQADEAYLDQRYDDALGLLDQAIKLDPNNDDIKSLHASVRAAGERARALKAALRRAEAAMQEGDFDEAEQALKEALTLDPDDTEAKALKSLIARQVEEKARHDQVRDFLDRARNQIAARDLSAAFASLETVKKLDPTSTELNAVLRLAQTAQKQENRRAELLLLHKQIESALQSEDYATAVAQAEEGLLKFPNEQSLIKLRDLADAQRRRVEQAKFVNEQFAAAVSLAESERLHEALAVLQQALREAPGNRELELLRETVKGRIASEEATKNKARALAAAIDQANQLLAKRGAAYAYEYLNNYAAQYGDVKEYRQFCDTVRERVQLDDLDAKLAIETDRDRRVELATEALQRHPSNRSIRHRLDQVRELRNEINTRIERAQALEAAGYSEQALLQWQELAKSYPHFEEFESRAEMLAERIASRKQPEVVPTPVPIVVEAAPEEDASSVASATVLLNSNLAPGGMTSTAPAPATPVAVPEEPHETASTADPVSRSRVILPARVRYVIGAVAIVTLVLVGYTIMRRTAKSVAVSVTANPEGTEIAIATQRCRAPCTITLPPGTYQLHAEHQGYEPLTESVVVSTDTTSFPRISLAPQPPPVAEQGTLVVRSKVEGAEVYVDNGLRGLISNGKYEGKLDAGSHDVMVKKFGYLDSALQKIEIANANTSETTFDLKIQAPTEIKDEPAYLVVQSKPGASVSIDHGSIGRVPPDGRLVQKVSPGNHSVAVSLDGYDAWSGTSTAEKGKQVMVLAALKEKLTPAAMAPVISSFVPSTSSIQAGKSVDLSWQTQHADEVTIDQGIGTVGKNGTMQVSPTKDTTYTLSAKSAGQVMTQRVTIAVSQPPAPPPPPAGGGSAGNANSGELEGIRKGLLTYKEAYESMDVEEMKKIWPTLSKDQMKKLKEGFHNAQAVKVEPNCGQPAFDGEQATMKCEQSMTWTRDGKKQPIDTRLISITLRKTVDRGWVVERIQTN